MVQKFAKAWCRTSVNVSPEFHKLCTEHRIKFSEAMKVGISILLAEKGVKEYDNSLTIIRRMHKITQNLEETSQKYYKLLEKLEDKEVK